MLSKEEFIDILRFMSKKHKQEDKFCGVLEELSGNGSFAETFIYSEYEEKLRELLRNVLHDEDDDLGYFLYELNGIDDVDIIVPDEECPRWEDKIMYNSASSLYDYLASNYKRC